MKPNYDIDALVLTALNSKIDEKQLEQSLQPYVELLGFVPPRVRDRMHITGALDLRAVELQEAVRDHAMATGAFEPKITQLIIFAMLMMDLSDAALTHAIAARRCGATWEELQAAVTLCFLFRGLSAANRGASVLAEAMQFELARGS